MSELRIIRLCHRFGISREFAALIAALAYGGEQE